MRRRRIAAVGPATTNRPAARRGRWVGSALLVGLLSTACSSQGADTTSRTDAVATGATGAGDVGASVEVVAEGRLFRISGTNVQQVATTAALDSAYARPTRTDAGLVALAGPPGGARGDLVLIGDAGATTLVTGVYSFAVDATGTRVAFATTPGQVNAPGSTSTLAVIDLTDRSLRGQATFTGVDGGGSSASIVGWAGDVVALNLGDGAGSRIGLWRPGANSVTVAGTGTVVAADPSRRRAILAFGDSGCGTVSDISSDLTIARTDTSPVLCAPVSFAPDGTRLGTVDAGTGRLSIKDAHSPGTEIASIQLPEAAAPIIGDVAFVDNIRAVVTRRNAVAICSIGASCVQVTVPATGPSATVVVADRRRPAGESAARAAIERAALAGIMGRGVDDPDAFIDQPEGIKAQRDALAVAYPEQQDAKFVLHSITLDSPTTASFTYDVELVGSLAARSLHDITGHAVKIGGTWKVTRASACQVWAFGNGVCPPIPTTTTTSAAAPTSRATIAIGDGVRYGRDGVWLADKGSFARTPLIAGPIASAYRLADGRLLYQRSDDNRTPTGPIIQRAGDASTDRPLLGSGPLDQLLDVAHSDNGRWHALIARRTGTNPDDTLTLLLYDLDDDTTRVLRRENGWEVGYQSARIIDGGVLFVTHATITQSYGVRRDDGTEWVIDGKPDQDAFLALFQRAQGPILLTNQRSIMFIDPGESRTARVAAFPDTCTRADLSPDGSIACGHVDRTISFIDVTSNTIITTVPGDAYTFTRR